MAKKQIPFINREISWLSFNERVLQEAADPTTPLIERLRFLGIFSNNRDEFFRIRVATVMRMLPLKKKAVPLLGMEPAYLLDQIQQKVIEQQHRFDQVYDEILDEFKRNNVFILSERQLNRRQQIWVRNYFFEEVLPAIFPIVIDDTKKFPYLKDRSSYLFMKLRSENHQDVQRYGLIEIPVPPLPRFILMPDEGEKKYLILLDDVIRFCLKDIFSVFHYTPSDAYCIKLTRDAEIDVDGDFNENLLDKISRGLKKRLKGQPVRLVFDETIPKDMLRYLMRRINLSKKDSPIPGGRYHNFRDYISFPKFGKKEWVYEHPHPSDHPALRQNNKSILKVIRDRDILLFYPYQNFNHIISLLREASIDPQVQSIKIALYRIASTSKIANALINAVKNGKSVTVLMELRARFDEENNINWSTRFQEEGVKVIFGVPSMKVHAKMFLITSMMDGREINYAHIGTGNFNENTAKVYSDVSLLTANKEITQDVKKVFEFFENNLSNTNFKRLLVAPFSMRSKFLSLIEKEIENARKKKPAWIIIKLNNLVDRVMINSLYRASKAGVQVKLIVRGICSLCTEVERISENISGVSIVDKYLEHSRIFMFCHDGEEKIYISSADWMTRNLDHRVEVACPVLDKGIKKEIKSILEIQWSANMKSRWLERKQQINYKLPLPGEKLHRAQVELFDYFLGKKLKTSNISERKKSSSRSYKRVIKKVKK
jgi:polyphosphate kinase